MTELLRTLRFDRRRAFRALSLGARAHHSAWRVNHRFIVLSV
jgi:acetolactate synthase regulatory subunit